MCLLGGCPVWNSNYESINGNCYYFEKIELTYYNAKANCKIIFGDKGRLFEPKDESTHDQVVAAGQGESYWIGINDLLTERKFQYVNLENVLYKNVRQGTLQYAEKILNRIAKSINKTHAR